MPHKLNIVSLNEKITRCRRCPRLIDHYRQVAEVKTRRYADKPYWGKPVPNFLPAKPQQAGRVHVLIVGLAPGAHGANRTGRMFTGDRSGDFLFDAMHRAGMCNQSTCTGPGDGLTLNNTAITSAAHCAPPGNRPTAAELNACHEYLDLTFAMLPDLRVVVSLGGIAHHAVLGVYRRLGRVDRLNQYPFMHGAWYSFDDAPDLACCYHPSQQNTFTGRLTPDMLVEVLTRARSHAVDGSVSL